MGYSVYVKTKDGELQKKMYNFLEKNMKDYRKTFFPKGINTINLAEGKDLAYSNKERNIIGFNYKTGLGMERLYIFEIVKWMSRKIGDGKHYEYDGTETCEITDVFEDEMEMDILQLECESFDIENLFQKSVDFIKNEIDRLNKLWNDLEEKK